MGGVQKRVLKFTILTFVMLALASKSESLDSANTSTTTLWVGSKYQIECTMCGACDNPCNIPSPPPPAPSPPPPSSTSYCPPPPSPPNSGGYYYSPPPPSQSNYYYYSPPPPNGVIGSYYPPPYKANPTGPTPPPPNPIIPYFPWYFHSPPPPDVQSTAVQFRRTSLTLLITPLLSICMLLFK